jgi:hypothetical protein
MCNDVLCPRRGHGGERQNSHSCRPANSGGVQMILGFFVFDFMASPGTPLQVILGTAAESEKAR